MKPKLLILTLFTALTGAGGAAPLDFDFKDPKGVNNITFKLDAPLEAISGSANGISGRVSFDPGNPAATKGRIVVASSSLTVSNPMQKEHMQSDKWLDVAKYPEIAFDVKELKNVKTEGEVTSAEAAGTFTLKGVARELNVPVKLTYLKDKLSARVPNLKGDLLVLRASFSINRGDFNIMAGQVEDKVANAIDLTVAIAGAAAR
ncbi:MAG: YceI family protein [Verrucomicrobiota bacterium]|jgi:polyisoprenoid-binding protein YceI